MADPTFEQVVKRRELWEDSDNQFDEDEYEIKQLHKQIDKENEENWKFEKPATLKRSPAGASRLDSGNEPGNGRPKSKEYGT